MAYPVILAPKGQEIMRVNYDASVSVQWDRILHYRYEPETQRNLHIVRICEMILAARDNFFPTPWEVSDSWNDRWDTFVSHIDYVESLPIGALFTMRTHPKIETDYPITARINRDGTWAVRWPDVVDIARLPVESWHEVPLIGFCRLMVAARDRFRTVSWDH